MPQINNPGAEISDPLDKQNGFFDPVSLDQLVGDGLERRRPEMVDQNIRRGDPRGRGEVIARGKPVDERFGLLVKANGHGARGARRCEGPGRRPFSRQPLPAPIHIEHGKFQLTCRYGVMRHCRNVVRGKGCAFRLGCASTLRSSRSRNASLPNLERTTSISTSLSFLTVSTTSRRRASSS